MAEALAGRDRARSALAIGAAVVLCCCRASSPPSGELRAILERPAASPAGAVRRTAWSRIESKWFSGEFRALVVEEPGPPVRIRFQLLPDLGGKVLDLVVTPTEVAGYWPHSGATFRESHGEDRPVPPRGLIGFLAVSLLENATPLDFERVRAMRREDGGYRLSLAPALAGEHTRVEVTIGADGTLLGRRYTHLGVSWSEVFAPEHRLTSKDFEWVLRGETAQEIAAPPESLFELHLPPEVEP